MIKAKIMVLLIIMGIKDVMAEVVTLVTIINWYSIDTDMSVTQDMLTIKQMVMKAKEATHMYVTICVLFALSQDTMNSIAMLLIINFKIWQCYLVSTCLNK